MIGSIPTVKSRLADLVRFYDVLSSLEKRSGGMRVLAECSGRMQWPRRGVYFFFEAGERRSVSGDGARVVRVGTHALTANSATSLWQRLAQHRGKAGADGGNHRGSIFRLIVGRALQCRRGTESPRSWGVATDPSAAARKLGCERAGLLADEEPLEREVSRHIGDMPFLWLPIEDDPGPESARGFVERNSIALLSNFDRDALDPPSESWLGRHSDRPRVRQSGLWNSNHVDETYAPEFLERLRALVELV